LRSNAGENEPYCSARRGLFEATPDWRVIWDTVVSLVIDGNKCKKPVYIQEL